MLLSFSADPLSLGTSAHPFRYWRICGGSLPDIRCKMPIVAIWQQRR